MLKLNKLLETIAVVVFLEILLLCTLVPKKLFKFDGIHHTAVQKNSCESI